MEATPAGKYAYSDELYLHVVAGHMLFPRDEENCTAYLCMGIDDVISSQISDGLSDAEAVSHTMPFVNKLFPVDGTLAAALLPTPSFSWDVYQYSKRNARFSAEGKGSIEERATRGRFAGLLLNLALAENCSLTEAAARVEVIWHEKRSDIWNHPSGDPLTVTSSNLMQNIWPEFKASAHLWAALQDFSVPDDAPLFSFKFFRLSGIAENFAIVMASPEGGFTHVQQTIWPSKFSGWRSLIYKSNHILEECALRGNAKGSTKPLLVADDCWQFSLPDD